MRKIIQIVGMGSAALALCDDNTLWLNERPYDPTGKIKACDWIRVRDIPQEPTDKGREVLRIVEEMKAEEDVSELPSN